MAGASGAAPTEGVDPVPYEFAIGAEVTALALRVRDFLEEFVIPRESDLLRGGHGISEEERLALQQQAKSAGVYGPTVPIEFGGLALDFRSQSIILEEAGRSLLGPVALNCAAPDEGNILLLEKVASAQQKSKYLEPLARGEVRSAFAMTEPSPGAGSDPGLLRTTAQSTGDRWVINGTKWFITGAEGSAFSIVMARTKEAATMFLVDAGNPGMTVRRSMQTIDSAFSGGHGIVDLVDCEVSNDAILGVADRGFDYAQVRLAPARLTHCMRWLGAARRAQQEAVKYASQRPMFNATLSDLGMAQQMLADNELDITSARMMIWRAAWVLDNGMPARHETSSAKVFVAEAVNRVVDRAVQLCGGRGVFEEEPIAQIFRDVRPFRIYDGPSEVHRWSIAKRIVRRSREGVETSDWLDG